MYNFRTIPWNMVSMVPGSWRIVTANLDRSVEAMEIAVVASSLVSLMLLHQR